MKKKEVAADEDKCGKEWNAWVELANTKENLKCELIYAKKEFAIPTSIAVKPPSGGEYIALYVPSAIFIVVFTYVGVKVWIYEKNNKFHSLNEAILDKEMNA